MYFELEFQSWTKKHVKWESRCTRVFYEGVGYIFIVRIDDIDSRWIDWLLFYYQWESCQDRFGQALSPRSRYYLRSHSTIIASSRSWPCLQSASITPEVVRTWKWDLFLFKTIPNIFRREDRLVPLFQLQIRDLKAR